MKKLILVSVLVLVLCSVGFCENDTSHIKGDYKTLCLGDTKDIVQRKVDSLLQRQEFTSGGKCTDKQNEYAFVASLLNQPTFVTLILYDNQLYQIELLTSFPNPVKTADFEQNLLALFKEQYGLPARTGYDYYVWEINNKRIEVGQINFDIKVIILSQRLMAQQKHAKVMDDKEKRTIAKKDFN